jgi:hypothetical protein
VRTRLALLSLVVLLALPAGSTLALADTGSDRGADGGSGRGTDGGSGRGTDAGPGSGHHGRGGSDDHSGPGWGQPAAHHPAIGYVPPPGVPASRGRVPVRPDPTPTPDPSPATIRRPTAAPTRAPAVASASGQGPTAPAAARPSAPTAAPTAPAAGFLPVAGVAGGLLLFVAMVAAGFRARARLGRLG